MGAVGPRARRRHEFKAGTPIVEVVDDGRGVRRCCGVAAGSSRLKRWASGSSRRRHAGEGGGDGQGRRARSSRGPTTCPSASCGRCLSKLTLARYLGERARDHSRADSSRRRSRGARARARAEGRIRRLQEARGGMVRTRGRDDLGAWPSPLIASRRGSSRPFRPRAGPPCPLASTSPPRRGRGACGRRRRGRGGGRPRRRRGRR